MDLINIITIYLHDNRRLVIPTLGTFIVKESGDILFSELLKTDDGVLTGLLSAEGMSELESAGIIDKFIFDVRNTILDKGCFEFGDLGTFTTNAIGEIQFSSRKDAGTKLVSTRKQTVGKEPGVTIKPNASKTVTQNTSPQKKQSKPDYSKPLLQKRSYEDSGKAKQGGIDFFMIVAIAVLIFAIFSIVWGVLRHMEQDDDIEMDSLRWSTEQQPEHLN